MSQDYFAHAMATSSYVTVRKHLSEYPADSTDSTKKTALADLWTRIMNLNQV
jgi:hypothetical protein